MGIVAYTSKQANDEVMYYAARNTPAVLIDCANAADPHKYHPYIDAETLNEIFVVGIDVLYNLPIVLRKSPQYLTENNSKTLCITNPEYLFHYQDQEENSDLRRIVWQLLSKLSTTYDIHIALKHNSPHVVWAKKYATMGHTTSSQRQVTANIAQELKAFIQTLPADEQQRAQQLIHVPMQRLGAITSASSLHTWAFFLLCIILEQEKHGSWTSFETKTS